jgi:hypothetical protein
MSHLVLGLATALSGTAYASAHALPNNLTFDDITSGHATYIELRAKDDPENPGLFGFARGELNALMPLLEPTARSYLSVTYLQDANGNGFPEIAAL